MKKFVGVVLLMLLGIVAHAQISDKDISLLEERLHQLAKKDESFKDMKALKFYHLFNVAYQGSLNPDTLIQNLLREKGLSYSFITAKRKKFVDAQSFIVAENGKLAGGDAEIVMFYHRYSKYYLNKKANLLKMIQQNNFRSVFRIAIDGATPLDIFWGINDRGLSAIVQKGDHFIVMPAAEFMQCCYQKHYSSLKK